jgi:hypothetical protein
MNIVVKKGNETLYTLYRFNCYSHTNITKSPFCVCGTMTLARSNIEDSAPAACI